MEENFKNKLGFWCFAGLVLVLGIGGYFFTNYALNTHKDKNNKKEENISYKIDSKKDYIYFENEETISSSADIIFKDAVINIKGQEVITETLKKENQIYKENITYIKDADLLTEDLVRYNNDGIHSLTYRKYDVFEYNDYVSLVINDYNYSCFDLLTYKRSKSYIFNIKNGKLLKEKEILKLYETSLDEIKAKVRTVLTESQSTTETGLETIKIDETINNFTDYAFYINEYGRLYISFLVKTNEIDYNKTMEVK